MTDLNNFQSINLSQFFDSVKFRSGLRCHSVIDYYKVMFYMLMMLMKFSFVRQNFFPGSGFQYQNHLKKLCFVF